MEATQRMIRHLRKKQRYHPYVRLMTRHSKSHFHNTHSTVPTATPAVNITNPITTATHTANPTSTFVASSIQPVSQPLIKTQLFPFQHACVQWMTDTRQANKHNQIILCLKMGIGKTLLALTHASQFGWKCLFLTPSGVVPHIKEQITTHCFDKIRVNQTIIPGRVLDSDITLLSYREFATLKKPNLDALCKITFSTIIFDEFHLLKERSKQMQHVSKLKAHFYIGLSGTYDPQGKNHIALMPHAIFYTNSSLAMPPSFVQQPEIHTPKLQLSPQELSQYQQELQKCKDANLNAILTFTQLRKNLSLQKIPHVAQFILQCPSHFKIACFSEFSSSLTSLGFHLTSRRSYVCVNTDTPIKSRNGQIKLFQQSQNNNLLLATRDIAGLGLDLGFVDILIVIEPTYHDTQMDQLVGRLTRLGQRPLHLHTQQVFQFIFQNTCEQQLIDCRQSFPSLTMKNDEIRYLPPSPKPIKKRNKHKPVLVLDNCGLPIPCSP